MIEGDVVKDAIFHLKTKTFVSEKSDVGQLHGDIIPGNNDVDLRHRNLL